MYITTLSTTVSNGLLEIGVMAGKLDAHIFEMYTIVEIEFGRFQNFRALVPKIRNSPSIYIVTYRVGDGDNSGRGMGSSQESVWWCNGIYQYRHIYFFR